MFMVMPSTHQFVCERDLCAWEEKRLKPGRTSDGSSVLELL